MFQIKKTVAGVVSSLQKNIDELNSVADNADRDVEVADKVIDATNTIRAEAVKEGLQARNVANNISKLIAGE
jgi:hypothetical protein